MAIPISKIPPNQLELAAQILISPRPVFYFSAYIVGLVTDAICFGVILQLYIKWHMYCRKDDRKLVRYLVWYLMIMTLATTCYFSAWIFHLFIVNFGLYAQFVKMDWNTWWFLLNTYARLPVSLFFAHRAWVLSGRRWILALVIGVLFVTAFAFTFPIKVFYKREDLQLHLLIIQKSCESVADVIVTTTIAIGLIRSKTGWQATDSLITRLLYLVAETQLPPTIVTTTFLGLYTPLASRPLAPFFACAPKAYILCLMISLNSRQSLRKDMSTHHDYSPNGGSRDTNAPPLSIYESTGPRPSTGIRVTTETSLHVDRNLPLRPKPSVNRGDHYQLEVESDPDSPNDKDSLEGRLNDSEIRLTREKSYV